MSTNVAHLRPKRQLSELAKILIESTTPTEAKVGDTVMWIEELCDLKIPTPKSESVITQILEKPYIDEQPFQPRSLVHAYVAAVDVLGNEEIIVEVGVDLRRMVIVDKNKVVQ